MARILVFGSLAESLISFRGPLLRDMVALGHQTFACAPNATKEIKDALTDLGVVYQHVMLDRTGLNPLNDALSLKKLVSSFKNIKPDVFLSYTIKPVIYGSFAARLTRVPKIFSIVSGLGYSFSDSDIKARMIGVAAKLLYSAALDYNKKVFFQNPDNIKLFASKGILKDHSKAVLVNGSGVDIDMYSPRPFPQSLSFLLLARLIREKGIYEYVEAAQTIRRKYPKVKFRLAGAIDKNPSAICKRDLQSWIDSGTIEYLGQLHDVRPAIADTSVYVLPSFYPEGTPRSVLEAMALGRPIITTDAPGCRETVRQEQNGLLIPLRDVDALINAMEYFIKKPDTIGRMGHSSRQLAMQKYDVRKVNQVMLSAMELV
jgi:glycosyltransferase involved in cell wall biosynthesis